VEFYQDEPPPKPVGPFEWVRLGDIVHNRLETIDPQAYPDRVFHYLGLENVESLTGDLANFRARYGREILSRSKVFRRGDILYGRLRPYLNKAYLAEGNTSEGICSGEFYVLTPRGERVLSRFLRTVLASPYVQQYVGSWQVGSALPRLPLEELMTLEIPLPPLSVQRDYEEFIAHQETSRRRLKAELEALPGLAMDAFVRALESGTKPVVRAARNETGNEQIGDALQEAVELINSNTEQGLPASTFRRPPSN
jgi:restriction endonuclease S subunit